MESFGRPAPSRGREALAADAASRKRVRLTEERIIDRDEERLRRALSQLEGRKASLREDRRQFEEQQEAKENYVAEEIEKTKLLLAISVGRRTTRANNERLDELPQEIWEKVFDKLGEHDLFPLALSCRYFRQKQKELVEKNQSKTLVTNLSPYLSPCSDSRDANLSEQYLQFCFANLMKEEDERKKVLVGRHIMSLAAKNGFVSLLEFLFNEKCPYLPDSVCIAAAEGGQLSAFQWAHNHGMYFEACKCSGTFSGARFLEQFQSAVVNRSDLRFLTWVYWSRSILHFTLSDLAVTAAAVRANKLDVLKWAQKHHFRFDSSVCPLAAEHGNLAMLKFLREVAHAPWKPVDQVRIFNGGGSYCIHPSVYTEAAKGGHLEIMIYAYNHGCPFDASLDGMRVPASRLAAQFGHLRCLRWCISVGMKLDKLIMEAAAEAGHLEIVCWLKRNGCPWDGGACDRAAYEGHLDVFIYLVQNGCPFDADECSEMASYGPVGAPGTRPDRGHTRIIDWIEQWQKEQRQNARREAALEHWH